MYLAVEQIDSFPEAELQKLNHPITERYGVEVDVLRLDKIHPVISGNKFFKLRFFIEEARQFNKDILTFGGPWSNHLLATAYACNRLKISCTGIIRGERSSEISETLADCDSLGMKLVFISRQDYRDRLIPFFDENKMVFVPEGGASSLGVRGAATILDYLDPTKYDEIACAVGTGTMMAGLLQQTFAMVRGISALKISKNADNSIESFLSTLSGNRHFDIDYRFHFGGYAKHPPELTSFMNEFYHFTGIPTDLVYTSKLFFGLLQLIQEGSIKPGSKICALHSGGLQGNRSLKSGTLVY